MSAGCRSIKCSSREPRADDLFYRPVWRKSVRRTARPGEDRAPASWMIFADAKGVGAAWPAGWKLRGIIATSSIRGSAFRPPRARAWTVNERQPQDFRRLLEQFAASETLPCDGVVYLWGLDAPSIDGLTLAQD